MTGEDVRVMVVKYGEQDSRYQGHPFYLTRKMRGYVRNEYRTVRSVLSKGNNPLTARWAARKAAYARAAWYSFLINHPPLGAPTQEGNNQ